MAAYVHASDLDDVYEYADDAARKGLRSSKWDHGTLSPRL